MKLLITFSVLLITTLANAQNKRFIYEYQFIPDSTNVSEVKSEMMNLDTSPSGSKFYSYTVYHADSISRIDLKKQLATTGMIKIKADSKKGLVRYSVSKKYPNYETSLHNRLLVDKYKVLDEKTMNWKISSDKQKFEEWNVQKAEADFGGRHWIAWFAAEIPIQDGPYKFRGLPGLIVKLEDRTKSHVFTLKGIKNLDSIPDDIFDSKEIAVNQKQYDKLVKDYENDPTKGLKQMQVGNIVLNMNEGTAKHMKEQEQRHKERIKKDNNRIELVTK